jgi:hypothetical protein
MEVHLARGRRGVAESPRVPATSSGRSWLDEPRTSVMSESLGPVAFADTTAEHGEAGC